jgi:hypothetical protein
MEYDIRTRTTPLDDLEMKILAILDKSPFEWTDSISERLLVACSIVWKHFHESIGFKSFHLHCVLHLLTDNLRAKQKEHARAMLLFLHAVERDGWRHLMSGDESWFFFHTSQHCVWILSRDDVVTKPSLDVQRREFMSTIVGIPSDFYVIDRLLNDTKMNSAYHVTNVLIPFKEVIFRRGRAPHQKHQVVHLDNCSVHTSEDSIDGLEEHRIRRMRHQFHSLDLALSNFYLFPTIK